ncbi:thialysine N-epsilon-acetyltransferase-like [Ptychodera flava]|uniref:thialysine N-epsilon-acetyltransferase-like n=1 Tax=Ptychodera flava TaxID=63121 RepID=UPI00396A313D
MAFRVREARPQDCGDIVRLIKELASYEKSTDQVHMTEHVLKRDGFGDEKFYHCFVADAEVPLETDDSDDNHLKVIAYALFFYAYSTWDGRMMYLEDIYVTPEFRGKGIGTALIKRILEVGLEKECQRIHLAVLDWNTSAAEFYKSKGFQDITERDGWHALQLNREKMEDFVKNH